MGRTILPSRIVLHRQSTNQTNIKRRVCGRTESKYDHRWLSPYSTCSTSGADWKKSRKEKTRRNKVRCPKFDVSRTSNAEHEADGLFTQPAGIICDSKCFIRRFRAGPHVSVSAAS